MPISRIYLSFCLGIWQLFLRKPCVLPQNRIILAKTYFRGRLCSLGRNGDDVLSAGLRVCLVHQHDLLICCFSHVFAPSMGYLMSAECPHWRHFHTSSSPMSSAVMYPSGPPSAFFIQSGRVGFMPNPFPISTLQGGDFRCIIHNIKYTCGSR